MAFVARFLTSARAFGSRYGETRWLWASIPIIGLVALEIWTGLHGIDFGHHWDEVKHTDALKRTIQTRTLLPGQYIYPSLNHWMNLAALAPSLAQGVADGTRGVALERYLLEVVDSQQLLIRMRALRVVLSSLVLAWVYLLALPWRKSVAEGLAAAAVVTFSSEMAYHSRWVAPDTIMMQFGALTMVFVRLGVAAPSMSRWRRLGAAAAALACGTKYPGGLLLLPVLLGTVLPLREHGYWRALKAAGEILLVFGLVFVATTPGCILQPTYFLSDLNYAMRVYGEQGHFGYSIGRGPAHLWSLLTYATLVLPSPYLGVAVLVTLVAAWGAWRVWTESRLWAIVLFSFPLAYVAYFCGQRVMLVRNLQVLVPFVAVLFGRGFSSAWHGRALRALRHIGVTVMLLLLALHARWLVSAAESIRKPDAHFLAEFADYLVEGSQRRILVSPRLRDELARVDPESLTNVTTSWSPDVRVVAAHASEAMPRSSWPANIRRLTLRTFGPKEVNFDYYPSWDGRDRIVLLTVERACAVGVRSPEVSCERVRSGGRAGPES